jgi:hypothetical protein
MKRGLESRILAPSLKAGSPGKRAARSQPRWWQEAGRVLYPAAILICFRPVKPDSAIA